jgi:transposase
MVDAKMGSRKKPEFVGGIRTNRTGRRTYTAEFKRAVVKQCIESGISLASVAMAHRINANLARRWVVAHRRALPNAKKEAVALLPVTIEANSRTADAGPEKRTHSSAGTIELEVYGARIRLRGGVDVASLRSVLDVLAQR